ncbi:hypothetical protein SERLA73DRAFT_173810 [Serpula lacrymans var. lacrymans S7.3]|uniref:Uncharacterized protein n=1 Tax=Serpula lacrymans var. lacrymans (strain S7.3) TaxID=936435 RepID=F8PHA0_SERL3|nr:hypothetical protein SERLA73DRAFT_173810 [Serpula lacrymans var. lacrymans S7.3]
MNLAGPFLSSTTISYPNSCMLHYACSLFITTTFHCLAVPSHLTGTLPDAAYRAWHRCASSTTRGSVHASSIHRQAIRARSRIKAPTVGVSSINPNSLLEYDMKWEDPGRSYISYEHHFSSCLPLTWVPPDTLKTVQQRFLFAQASPLSFYQNLLVISSCQQSPLSAAIKYHSFPPCTSSALRSTRSYNLLIRLALRHASLGTAWQLFSTMRAEGVQGNLETWKLSVRWLVRTGQWEEAWHRVNRIVASQTWAVSSYKAYNQRLLLPIWLEFFGTPKRGSTHPLSQCYEIARTRFLWNVTLHVIVCS